MLSTFVLLVFFAYCNATPYFLTPEQEFNKLLGEPCYGYWPLNSRTGGRDITTNQYHARLVNHPTPSPTGPYDKPSSGLNLSPDSYIELQQSGLEKLGSESFTISLFTKFNDINGRKGSPLFEWAYQDGVKYGSHLWYWSNDDTKSADTLWFNTVSCGYVTLECPTNRYQEWRHVAVSYNQETNSVRLVCDTATKIFPLGSKAGCKLLTTDYVLLGQRNVQMDHNLHFDGSLACLSIYRTAVMSKDQMDQIKKMCRSVTIDGSKPAEKSNSKLAPFVNKVSLPTSCVGYWPLMSTWPVNIQDISVSQIPVQVTSALETELKPSNDGPFGETATPTSLAFKTNSGEPGHLYFSQVPKLAKLNQKSFTVSMFAKLDQLQVSPLFEYSFRNTTTKERGMLFWFWPDTNTFHLQTGACDASTFVEVRCPNDGSVWRHVAAIYDKDAHTAQVYCDGNLSTLLQLDEVCIPNTTDLLYLGYRDFEPGHNRMFEGKMACVSVYEEALDGERLGGEIKEICRTLATGMTQKNE